MLATAREAIALVDTIETLVVVPRIGPVAESVDGAVTTLALWGSPSARRASPRVGSGSGRQEHPSRLTPGG